MAKHVIWEPEHQAAWEDWVSERPPEVQEICRKWPANVIWELTTTGQRVLIQSYSEDQTVMVHVPPELNPTKQFVGHAVFGIDPNDLVESDFPPELLGLHGPTQQCPSPIPHVH